MMETMEEPEERLVMLVLTCHQHGCENQGIPITLEAPEDVRSAVCGACGTTITDREETDS